MEITLEFPKIFLYLRLHVIIYFCCEKMNRINFELQSTVNLYALRGLVAHFMADILGQGCPNIIQWETFKKPEGRLYLFKSFS